MDHTKSTTGKDLSVNVSGPEKRASGGRQRTLSVKNPLPRTETPSPFDAALTNYLFSLVTFATTARGTTVRGISLSKQSNSVNSHVPYRQHKKNPEEQQTLVVAHKMCLTWKEIFSYGQQSNTEHSLLQNHNPSYSGRNIRCCLLWEYWLTSLPIPLKKYTQQHARQHTATIRLIASS